jgi:hypothetical protein
MIPVATSLAAEYENEITDTNRSQRSEIIDELEDLGVVTSSLSLLTDGELESLLGSLSGLLEAHAPRRGRPRAHNDGPVVLSEVDRKILHHFFPGTATLLRFRCQKSLACP